MTRSQRSTFRTRITAIPLRALWHRFAFLVLALAAAWLLVLGQIRPQVLMPVRIGIVDSFTPILDAITRPGEVINAAGSYWQAWIKNHDEVLRLRVENARLRAWEQNGSALAAENQELRRLLNFHAEPASTAIAARVIATAGGPFADGIIVTAGKNDGVRKGMAAVTGEGLIGRVTEVGDWSARVLLITDINSRIPVMLQDDGARGILVGGDRPQLQLMYLPPDAAAQPGARVVTSGHGGVFPPRIPVGIVTAQGREGTMVVPVADLGRINYVQLVDFNLAGGASNGFGRALQKTDAAP